MKCLICEKPTKLFDTINFNKSVEQEFVKESKLEVGYNLCSSCGHIFCPEICSWDKEKILTLIYNNEYLLVDPEYIEKRPTEQFNNIIQVFNDIKDKVTHLDYGGGNGLLSKKLKGAGWVSDSYDPFVDYDFPTKTYNFITCFEVFEHVPDPISLMVNINKLLTKNGVMLFTTALSDGQFKNDLNWNYIAPRNGHISIFSGKSLDLLVKRFNGRFRSTSAGSHMYFKGLVPSWFKI